MKMIKRNIVLTVSAMLTSFLSYGQSFDEVRMDRDIKVAENILETLLNEDDTRLRLGSNNNV
ncbi:MAG: hypothetical protein AAFY41_18445, partial [Bacteroidota bacterium]